MSIEKVIINGKSIAVLSSDEALILDEASALDILMSVAYQTDTHHIAIQKEVFPPAFFQLSSGLAGAILQKVVTYAFRIAIYGDYSLYTSKPLRDFIYESNNQKTINFVATQEDALSRLSS